MSQGPPITKPVPIWQTGPLPPLDYKKLSGGKVAHYIPSPYTPNDSAQQGMLETCRELPIKNATARSAFVVIKCSEGKIPVSALVVGNLILLNEGQFVRGLQITSGTSRTEEVLYPNSPGSILLTMNSKVVLVGKRKIELQHKVMAPPSGGIVLTLPDLLTIFHERDAQLGGRTIESTEIACTLDPTKLYTHGKAE